VFARVAVALLERGSERRDHVPLAELGELLAPVTGVQDHLAPTRSARLLQGRTGGGDESLRPLPRLKPGNADRHRDPPDRAHLDVLQLDEDALDGRERLDGLGLSEEDGELIAPHPAREVVHPRLVGDQVAQAREHRVARGVAVLQIQTSEAVDVQQRDAEGPAVALRARDVQLELGPEGAQAEQASGERVAVLQLGKPALELGDALARRRELLREAVPVPGAQVVISIGADGVALEA